MYGHAYSGKSRGQISLPEMGGFESCENFVRLQMLAEEIVRIRPATRHDLKQSVEPYALVSWPKRDAASP
jgi:hypothetical protein